MLHKKELLVFVILKVSLCAVGPFRIKNKRERLYVCWVPYPCIEIKSKRWLRKRVDCTDEKPFSNHNNSIPPKTYNSHYWLLYYLRVWGQSPLSWCRRKKISSLHWPKTQLTNTRGYFTSADPSAILIIRLWNSNVNVSTVVSICLNTQSCTHTQTLAPSSWTPAISWTSSFNRAAPVSSFRPSLNLVGGYLQRGVTHKRMPPGAKETIIWSGGEIATKAL